MNTNETERDDAYDRACRDPRDNCPTEGAVLKREWRQKTATIAILTAELESVQADALRYRWLRDQNDWYAEPRIDEADGTKWELVFYTPQRIEDPTDDDNLDAAIDAAMGASK